MHADFDLYELLPIFIKSMCCLDNVIGLMQIDFAFIVIYVFNFGILGWVFYIR